jgi:Family of unknown function (DUF5681)
VPFPDPANQFKPGVSGNPAGLSKRRRMADRLLDALEVIVIEKGIDTGDLLAREWIAKMIQTGDTESIRALCERTDGPVPRADRLVHDGELVVRIEYADDVPRTVDAPYGHVREHFPPVCDGRPVQALPELADTAETARERKDGEQ